MSWPLYASPNPPVGRGGAAALENLSKRGGRKVLQIKNNKKYCEKCWEKYVRNVGVQMIREKNQNQKKTKTFQGI